MLKKRITYTNPFTDEEVTEEHYFNISKADLVTMNMEEASYTYEKDGQVLTGMQAKLQRVVDSNDGKVILAELKDMIRRSYLVREGDKPIKSQAIWEEFESSEAFSQLLFDLCTDAEAASEFIQGILPKNMEQIANEINERARAMESTFTPVDATSNGTPAGAQVLTPAQAAEMDATELQSGLAAGRYKLS